MRLIVIISECSIVFHKEGSDARSSRYLYKTLNVDQNTNFN